MKLLLDTNALIWWFSDDPRLGPRTRSLIADSDSTVLVSIVSLWEVSIKHRIGKLDLRGSDLMAEARACGFAIVEIQPQHLAHLEVFEAADGHKDPFDLFILVHALAEGATLVTTDRRMRSYGVPCL